MKYVLVTGASGGIGSAVCNALLDEGYGIWAINRHEDNKREAYADERVNTLTFDFNNLEEISSMIKTIVAKTGPIAGLVHCAGFDKLSPIYLNKQDNIEALFRIHVYAAMELCKQLAKKGNSADGCSIVLISSLSAHEGAKGHTAYAAAKGAIEGFLKPAAAELVERNIRINEVVLGVVETQMSNTFVGKLDEKQRFALDESYPLGLGKPEDVSSMIAFLISDKASWITGQKYVIDGGHMARKV